MHRKEVTHSNGSYARKLRGRKLADEMGQGISHGTLQSDAPEESDLWTAWQLFPLDDDQTFDFKDRVGVERLYNSVEFDEPVAVELKIGRSYRQNVVGKTTSGRRGLWALISGP